MVRMFIETSAKHLFYEVNPFPVHNRDRQDKMLLNAKYYF